MQIDVNINNFLVFSEFPDFLEKIMAFVNLKILFMFILHKNYVIDCLKAEFC